MVAAIQKEIPLRKEEFTEDTIVQTIYFGGGTPSILAVAELETILDTISKNFTIATDAEITIEANPDDLTIETIKNLANSPINRLSIGVQSFFDQDLQVMNRAHQAAEAFSCITHAKQYFDNISIDLIYGIPNMSLDRWEQNIQIALDQNIPHISCYALTVEPNTALPKLIEKGIIAPVDDQLAQQHFDLLIQRLEHSGYEHYELSNFGKPNYHSRNNTAYWQGKPYLGIGPAAHSYSGKHRSWNISNNSTYIAALAQNKLPSETEYLSTTDQYNEYVMTGLRTQWGVSLQKITDDFGASYRSYILEQAQKHLKEHLLFLDNDRLFVTRKGKFLSDGIASDLFLLNLS